MIVIPAKPFLAAAALVLLAVPAVAVPPFPSPAESAPPFRRDKLPMDTDSMVSLSRDLERLSLAASYEQAVQRRAAAQALALALVLDPANTSARNILSRYAEGKSRQLDVPDLDSAKSRIWQLHGWLSSPEAGIDGNLLADLMGDAASTLDPRHPGAAELREAGERGKWEGWVAPLSGFEDSKPVRTEKPPESSRETPNPASPSKQPGRIALKESSLETVLYAFDKQTEGNRFGRTVAHMEARMEDRSEQESEESEWSRPDGLWIDIACPEEDRRDVMDFIATPIRRALESVGVAAPENARITLHAGDNRNYSFRRNTLAISGVGFLLAHAALTGIEPDGTAIGIIDASGNLATPHYLWYYVDALRGGEGGRLVIPASAEEHFLALLTFEEPDFFLKYEVFTAATPKEFAELSAKKPGDKQASVSSRFDEIRDKAPASGLGPYLANRFVRQRLLDIHAEIPQHLSAKMLAIQGSSERPPRTLSRKVLASVIWKVVAPFHSALEISPFEINEDRIKSMEKTHEDARAALALLDRLTERSDAELLTRAKAAASDLRSLTRAFRSRSDDWDTRYAAIAKAFESAKKSNEILRKELSQITGEPLPEDALDRLRETRGSFRGE